jgi:cytoskeleton protein RodZ
LLVTAETIGSRLRQARESSGLSLREIATRTKISMTALEALERNDFTRLPGGIFGRAFVRAYALEIGVDPDETVERFVKELERYEEAEAARGAARPEITDDDREFLARQRRAMLALRIGVAILLIAAILLFVWRFR